MKIEKCEHCKGELHPNRFINRVDGLENKYFCSTQCLMIWEMEDMTDRAIVKEKDEN